MHCRPLGIHRFALQKLCIQDARFKIIAGASVYLLGICTYACLYLASKSCYTSYIMFLLWSWVLQEIESVQRLNKPLALFWKNTTCCVRLSTHTHKHLCFVFMLNSSFAILYWDSCVCRFAPTYTYTYQPPTYTYALSLPHFPAYAESKAKLSSPSFHWTSVNLEPASLQAMLARPPNADEETQRYIERVYREMHCKKARVCLVYILVLSIFGEPVPSHHPLITVINHSFAESVTSYFQACSPTLEFPIFTGAHGCNSSRVPRTSAGAQWYECNISVGSSQGYFRGPCPGPFLLFPEPYAQTLHPPTLNFKPWTPIARQFLWMSP